MSSRVNFAEANRLGLGLVRSWLPEGREEGDEWVALNPTRSDDRPGSFKVNLASGLWSDFATGDKGGDAVSLFAYLHGLEQAEAARRILGQGPGIDGGGNGQGPKARTAEKPPTLVLLSVEEARSRYGAAEAWMLETAKKLGWGDRIAGNWTCKDAEGRVELVAVRFEGGARSKNVISFYYDGKFVRTKGYPVRLFGRDLLAASPELPVAIHFGEKCWQAAQAIPGYVPVTWNGGEKKARLVDWGPLAGRQVVVYPDDDPAGRETAAALREILPPVVASLRIVQPLEEARKIKGKGADVVEALQVLTPEQFAEYLRSGAELEPAEEPVAVHEDLNELLGYDRPSLQLLMRQIALARTDDGIRGFFTRSFARDIHSAHQVAGALHFEQSAGERLERLIRIGNTLWIWDESLRCHRPMIDLTSPTKPIRPTSFAHGGAALIAAFGSIYEVKNPETKKMTRRVFNRNATEATGVHFCAYAQKILTDRRDLLAQRPEKTVSCSSGVLLWDETKKDFNIEPHSPARFMTLPAFPVRYSRWGEIPEARRAPLIRYLDNLLPTELEADSRALMIEFYAFIIGFSLTPWRDKIVVVLIGDNDSGKSTFVDLCIQPLHSEGGTLKLADFLKMATRPGDFDYSAFDASLVVEHDDFQPGGELPAQVLKHVANKNLPIEINRKFMPPYQTPNTAMVIIGTNGNPRSTDSYLASRLVCVPFQRCFSLKEQADPELQEPILELRKPELREVLFSFGIEGLKRFWTQGLEGILPAAVRAKTEQVRGSLNDAIAWIEEAIAAGILMAAPSDQLRIKKAELYDLYRSGHRESAMGRNSFYSEAAKRFAELKSEGTYYFTGVQKAAPDRGEAP